MYSTGGQSYFVPESRAGFPAGGSGTIISSRSSDQTEDTGDADTYSGLQSSDTVNTGSGNDTVYAGAGHDSVTTGDGNDSVQVGAGNDTTDSGNNNDRPFGNEGADSLLGDAGLDTMSGGTGADYIDGGSSSDNIDAGSDDDSITGDSEWLDVNDHASTFDGPATTLNITNGADGPIELWWIDGSGTPAYYSTIPAGWSVNQPTFIAHNIVLRGEDGSYLQLIEGGNQTLTYGAEGLNDSIDGNSGNDTIWASSEMTRLRAMAETTAFSGAMTHFGAAQGVTRFLAGWEMIRFMVETIRTFLPLAMITKARLSLVAKAVPIETF